jgi:restriction system protein
MAPGDNLILVGEPKSVWGFHTGGVSLAEALLLEENQLAVDFGPASPISLLQMPGDWESFKAAIAANAPNLKPGAVPVVTGQLWRFVHGLALGDLIVYRPKGSGIVHLGVVSGDYAFVSTAASYRHRRPVEWKQHASIANFTQGALFELGAYLTLFKISKYADEFSAATGGAPALDAWAPATDATVTEVSQDIEQTTSDYVFKTLASVFKGHGLAFLVAAVLRTIGYKTTVSPAGPDAGVDILAHPDDLGFRPPRVKVQVKSGDSAVGSPDLQALVGTLAPDEFGLFVALGGFTAAAVAYARGLSRLRLVGGQELVDLVLERYDQLPSEVRAQLPLRRVLVPVGQPASD